MNERFNGELRDLGVYLDGIRQTIAHRLGSENEVFRRVDNALRSHDADRMRLALAYIEAEWSDMAGWEPDDLPDGTGVGQPF